jgi:2-keto-4-pentenoate hydratase/2-oxohepta-3-ene-1,7-dioic acid hydratase in catechol pathway
MRLASFIAAGEPGYGIVAAGGIVELGRRLGERAPDLRSLLALGVEEAASFAAAEPDIDFAGLAWEPPIPNPSQILCIGLNYRDHVAEVGRPLGDRPTVFLRVAQSQTGHRRPIVRPRVSDQLDFEGELAVIVGRRGRHIATENALSHVAGYAPYNDASLRDWQRHSGQYTAGKNFPSTGAFGPWLVTADEVPDPTSLRLTTRLNGVDVQRGSLDELVFSIPQVLSYISTFTELRPGDVVLTGTPAGVGSLREPKLWMRPGDVVEVEVSGLGTLVNPVVEEISYDPPSLEKETA